MFINNTIFHVFEIFHYVFPIGCLTAKWHMIHLMVVIGLFNKKNFHARAICFENAIISGSFGTQILMFIQIG